jgi:hypothetical protein
MIQKKPVRKSSKNATKKTAERSGPRSDKADVEAAVHEDRRDAHALT